MLRPIYEDPIETPQDIIEKDYTLFGNVGEIWELMIMANEINCDVTILYLGQEHYIDLLKNSPNKYFKQLSEAHFDKEFKG